VGTRSETVRNTSSSRGSLSAKYRMRWNEITEAMRGEPRFGSRREFLTKVFRYTKAEIDSYLTRESFMASYRELMSHLVFPLTVYRGMSFGDDIWFDAHHDNWDEQEPEGRAGVEAAIRKIDYSRIGTSWTWDRRCAVEGGKLAGGDASAHVIVEAVVTARQVDQALTIFQNLTLYEEEKEVRLLANTPIKIIGITPNVGGIHFPLKANTGPESWDDRNSSLNDLDRWSKHA
jgi:hypothetical protein